MGLISVYICNPYYPPLHINGLTTCIIQLCVTLEKGVIYHTSYIIYLFLKSFICMMLLLQNLSTQRGQEGVSCMLTMKCQEPWAQFPVLVICMDM